MSSLQTLERANFLVRLSATPLRSRTAVPAKMLTTFGLGGAVELLFEPTSLTELEALLAECEREGFGFRILGAGSNVIFSDLGISEPVIRLAKGFSGYGPAGELSLADWLRTPSFGSPASGADKDRFYVLGATSLMSLSRDLSQKGYSGLEFAAGIPASIGGAAVMNAGAHGHSMSEVLKSVLLINEAGQIFLREHSALNFSYRHSAIGPREIVLAVELELPKGDPEAIRAKRSACLDYRRKTQPLAMPSSGSVFKNPSQDEWARGKMPASSLMSAGAILESAGLKGKRSGSVAFSELHANWLVRLGENGKTSDALNLIDEGIRAAGKRYGVELKREMIVWS